MTYTGQDALERAPIQLLVVDDENMRFAQGGVLRGAEGGTPGV
jgi:hypothetical protein